MPRTFRWRRLGVLPALLVLTACGDVTHLAEPAAEAPSFTIADAARGYKAGFYWLPPMVSAPLTSGTVDPALSPVVTICHLAGDACGAVLVTYTMTTGTGSEVVRLSPSGDHYAVNWHTNQFDLLPGAIYRIAVTAGPGILLGYADVQPVNSGKDLKNVNTNEYVALLDGRTLPIKFRIETGIVAAISVLPADPTIALGETVQLAAVVTDLHGDPLDTPVTWASLDPAVAGVDAVGLVTGVWPGSAVIAASAAMVSGSTTVEVTDANPLLTPIVTGLGHACRLDHQGTAWCWGRNHVLSLGNAGAGEFSSVPVPVEGGLNFVSLAAGDLHTCGLTPSGVAHCWGYNAAGQSGTGASSAPVGPGPVVGGLTFEALSAGGSHTCGLRSTGAIYCWGNGLSGALGNGATGPQLTPTPVAGPLVFTDVRAGTNHTCGLLVGGAAYCWGLNGSGQLGNGTTTTSNVPVEVVGGHAFDVLAGGSSNTCAVALPQALYCWGRGSLRGVGTHSNSPVPVQVPGQWSAVAVGVNHACGIAGSGAAFCWGNSSAGELGNGLTGPTMELTPVAVLGGHTFMHIAIGFRFTCGVTLGGDGYCWGENVYGQLGNGGTANSGVPALVNALP